MKLFRKIDFFLNDGFPKGGLPKKNGIFWEFFPKWGGGHLEGHSLPFTTHPIKLKVDLLWPLLLEFSNIQII